MPGVAGSNAGRTRAFIADETASSTVVPVLLDERSRRGSEGALRRDLSLRLLLLFLYRQSLFLLAQPEGAPKTCTESCS